MNWSKALRAGVNSPADHMRPPGLSLPTSALNQTQILKITGVAAGGSKEAKTSRGGAYFGSSADMNLQFSTGGETGTTSESKDAPHACRLGLGAPKFTLLGRHLLAPFPDAGELWRSLKRADKKTPPNTTATYELEDERLQLRRLSTDGSFPPALQRHFFPRPDSHKQQRRRAVGNSVRRILSGLIHSERRRGFNEASLQRETREMDVAQIEERGGIIIAGMSKLIWL